MVPSANPTNRARQIVFSISFLLTILQRTIACLLFLSTLTPPTYATAEHTPMNILDGAARQPKITAMTTSVLETFLFLTINKTANKTTTKNHRMLSFCGFSNVIDHSATKKRLIPSSTRVEYRCKTTARS